MTLIYIVNGKAGFYKNPEDKTNGLDLYKKLLKKYGCEPIIIPVDTNPDSEFELSGKITPEQVLHLMAQTTYNPNEKKPITYELTATAPDELNFGRKGDVPTPYVFDGMESLKEIPTETPASPNTPVPSTGSSFKDKSFQKVITAYTDGSFNVRNNTAGYAAILTTDEGGEEKVLSGSITNPQLVTMRNVAGELQAVLEALSTAEDCYAARLSVYYDYEGIEKWVTGEWKAKKEFTQRYRDAVRSSSVKVEFHKVAAHTGVDYNERADKLAKAACGM